MKPWITGAIVSIGLAAAAPLALADSANTPPPGGPMSHQGEWSHHEKSALSAGERVEARLAYVKTALKITDAQKSQWDAFADAERKQAQAREKKMQEWHAKYEQRRDERGAPGAADHKRPSAIERLEHEKEFLSDAQAALDAKLAAIKPLYAALSDKQKAVADEILAERPHGAGGPGGFGHGGEHKRG
jgi:hypothetical protein